MRTSIGLLLVCSVAACDGGGGSGTIGLDDLDDEFEEALCEGQVACGAMPDLATCLAVTAGGNDLAYLAAAVEAGTVTYDGSRAAECLDFFRDLTCRISQGLDPEEANAACEDVFVGQVAEGGACLEDEECAGNGECAVDCPESCCAGVCVPGEGGGGGTIPIGGDCAEADCVSGAYCRNDFSNGTAVCEAVVADGGECHDWDACAAGLWCGGFDFSGTPGTCAAPPDRGESCEGFGLCDRADDYCDMTDLVCKARKQPGEPCNVDTNECVDWATCWNGTCAELPGPGDDCAEIGECLGDLDCVSGACADPTPAEPCTPPAP